MLLLKVLTGCGESRGPAGVEGGFESAYASIDAAQMQRHIEVGCRLATSDVFPAWRETSEFRAARAADGG